MTLMRRDPYNLYNPFEESFSMMREMMDRMRSTMTALALPENTLTPFEGANALAVDMTSDENEIVVKTALPGFKEDEVHVDVRGNILTIWAEAKQEREDRQRYWHIRELRYGRFERSLPLPEEVVTDKADATLDNGILTVRLPKQRPSPIQRIAVKARNLLKGGSKK